MCEVKHGHNYESDAEAEMRGEVGKWDKMLESMRSFSWLLIPLLVWVFRVELRLGPGGADRDYVDAEIEKLHKAIEELPPEIYRDQQNERYQDLKSQLNRMETKIDSNGAAILRHVEGHNQ